MHGTILLLLYTRVDATYDSLAVEVSHDVHQHLEDVPDLSLVVGFLRRFFTGKGGGGDGAKGGGG